jgi:hypothetical protein
VSKRKHAHAVVVELEVPVAPAPVEVDAEVAADNAKPASVVRPGYKATYAKRAADAGLGKVAQRSCWDWLAASLAGEVLVDTKLDVAKFHTLLEANGVDHSRWTNRSKGWEGRLRMTGRLALQKVVAANGVLHTADGEQLEAPADWIAKHTH